MQEKIWEQLPSSVSLQVTMVAKKMEIVHLLEMY
jgi:hypothetical protein